MNADHDPLTVLHQHDEPPVAPDPEFAARLRARLEVALTLPNRTEGVVMTGTDTAIAELNSPSQAAPRPAVISYLTVADARAAIGFYVDALGARVLGDPIVMDDGRIGHAELSLAGGVLYLADEFPEIGLKAPAPNAVSVSLMLSVPDTDAALARAAAHGARVQREPYEDHGARNATFIDPSGHRWMLSGPVGVRVPVETIRHGDVGYVSVWVPDADRAAAFYGHVLGWTYDPATRQVTNTQEHIGIFSVAGAPTLFCCYAVDDLDAARRAITAGGGTSGEVRESEFGTVLDATDPAGTAFAVFEPAPGTPRPAVNGTGPGSLSYITYNVPDSAAFKEFYGHVLSWTFEPGRIADGWGVQNCQPMSGMAGGSDRATTVPMWTVADIDAAVTRVREAGGNVISAPARQPYGLMAECTDDQGARFYLGEF